MSKDMPLVLVDGSSYLFRAYYAMPPLTTRKGFPSGAIYGVINMLKRLLKDYPGAQVAVVFDSKKVTFRKELYPEYKANRDEMPGELAQQIEPLHKIIRAMGFPLLIADGVEADDVIGTLAIAADQQGNSTLISTGDKDMAQLVNERITLVNTMNDKLMDAAGVEEKFGVRPDQMIDYLALMGDASDNIPGVPKVGPKTAAKWLKAYDTLEGVVAHAAEITGKVGESLRDSLDQLPLSKQLVTIRCDVPVELPLDQLVLSDPDQAALMHWYQELEFTTWLNELGGEAAPTSDSVSSSSDDCQYDVVLDQQLFDSWMDKLREAKVFAIDVETTSLNDMTADLVGVSVAVTPGQAAYIPLGHDYPDAPEQLSQKEVLKQLQDLLGDPETHIVGQNIKYDIKVLRRAGVTVKAHCDDTMLQSYVLHNVTTRHDMDTLALKFLNHQTTTFEMVAGKGAKQKTFNQILLEEAAPYAAEDADITLQLFLLFQQQLEKDPDLQSVYDTIERPLMSVLMDVEYGGVLLDAGKLGEQSEALQQEIEQLEQRAYELAGEVFNLASPKQLQHILFEKLNVPVIKKTPKGQPSTAEAVLQELAADYPLPKVIVSYRSLAKLKSTYTDKLPQQINQQSGRVHTHYNQAVTSTGRLSSNDPNLQNIPVRTVEGRRVRQAFIAPEGKKIVAADYSQVELRIMAHMSQDPGMLQAFAEGVDIHQATASEVFGVELNKVSSDQRRHAKAINFGLLYGMSAFGLSKQLHVDRGAAQHYIDSYFARYPKVLEYMEVTRQRAADQGYVTTLMGRRLMFPEIQSSNAIRRKAAERAAINAPLQGTAADIIKLAMINIARWIDDAAQDITMIMQVHDELVFEIACDDVEQSVGRIRQAMESVVDLSVPLLVDVGVGNNWEEAH